MSAKQLATIAFSGVWFYYLEQYRKRQLANLAVAMAAARFRYGADSPEYLELDQKARLYDSAMKALPYVGSTGAYLLGPRLAPKLMA
jgi:hypothetical protein